MCLFLILLDPVSVGKADKLYRAQSRGSYFCALVSLSAVVF